MDDFVPINQLERALVNVQAGHIGMPNFLGLFSRSDIAVPSAGEVRPDWDGFQPLLFNKNGVEMVACFTSAERIGSFGRTAPYCLSIKGTEFMRRMPPGYGLVVNPGYPAGFDIHPDGLRRIVTEFAG